MPVAALASATSSLLQPVPRYLVTGVVLVVASAAFASTGPWFLRRALDGIRAGAPLRSIWLLGAAMIGVSLIGGVGRFWMRELLNGMSRWIEYDLRNDLFRQFRRARRHILLPRANGRPHGAVDKRSERRSDGRGPAIMYLTNTIAGGAFALGVHAVHLAAIDADRRAPDGAPARCSAFSSGDESTRASKRCRRISAI